MPIILYELIGTESKRYYSPNTYKTRLSLLHKGVSFETREVTYHDLRYNLAKRLGMKRPTGPSDNPFPERTHRDAVADYTSRLIQYQ